MQLKLNGKEEIRVLEIATGKTRDGINTKQHFGIFMLNFKYILIFNENDVIVSISFSAII